MKKLFALILALLMLCSCGAKEPLSGNTEKSPPEQPENEKVAVTIGGEDYEMNIPEKTRINDNSEGNIEIFTSSLTEPGTVVDLSGLSGCEYINSLVVKLNGEGEKLILPYLPNLSYCEIYGNAPELIDASAMEDYTTLSLYEILPDKIDIGSGPESLVLGYGFDLSKLAGAENVKNITIHGNADLSKTADIGEVESVYIFGENDNVAGLENLKSLKKLSFQAFSGDLSGIGKLSMETLAFNSNITQETIDTLSESETVTELHINDEFITKSDFLDKLPNLKTLVISVLSTSSFEAIDETQLESLETNIPKEALKAFMEKGGEIYLVYDWSRT